MNLKTLSLAVIVFLLLTNAAVYSQVPPYVPANGLIGYWGFNGNANDESGNNNHGIPANVVSTTDRFGNENSAYQFNGKNSRIDVPNAFFNIGWNTFTISCWTYSTSFLNQNNYNDSQVIVNTDLHNGKLLEFYLNLIRN